jgi:hypothetical protein
MPKPADLNSYLFQGQIHPLAWPLRRWMDASPRFTTFVDTYRDKIRKKIRVVHEPQAMLDLQAELEAAARLLADRRLELTYEPYASAKQRGPDFAVTYRTNLTFNVEVTRLRAENGERILRTLLEKLGQMQPGMPNLLAIHAPPEAAKAIDLGGLMQELKILVDNKDSAFYTFTGYTNPAAFYKDFLRVSGLLLWGPEVQVWVNRQARPALDEKVVRLVASLLAAAGAP